jgi:uncharacterized protein (DUF934 family)
MAALIDLQGIVVADSWRMISDDEALNAATRLPGQNLILTIPLWRTSGENLVPQGHKVGVWLWPDDDPESLISIGQKLPIIAVHFPVFTDGRGYTHAKILRERLGYIGELRATGDVLRDQIYFLSRCGFSSFALRADQNPEECLSALNDFSWAPLVGHL